jgi:hypothetical protein
METTTPRISDTQSWRLSESTIDTLRINNAESFLDKKFRRRLPVARSMDSATPHIKLHGVSDSPEQQNAESLILPLSRFSITYISTNASKKTTSHWTQNGPPGHLPITPLSPKPISLVFMIASRLDLYTIYL